MIAGFQNWHLKKDEYLKTPYWALGFGVNLLTNSSTISCKLKTAVITAKYIGLMLIFSLQGSNLTTLPALQSFIRFAIRDHHPGQRTQAAVCLAVKRWNGQKDCSLGCSILEWFQVGSSFCCPHVWSVKKEKTIITTTHQKASFPQISIWGDRQTKNLQNELA
jgi:hypothetical protein